MINYLRELFILFNQYPWTSFCFFIAIITVLNVLIEVMKVQLKLIGERNKMLCAKKTSQP